MPTIFLDPAGTIGQMLLLIVRANTGVVYEQQCGGYLCEQRKMEGFLIPVGGAEAAEKIYDWFWKNFKGHCYDGKNQFTPTQLEELKSLVGGVRCWIQSGDESEPRQLELDVERIAECVEAWIPVVTPFGKGILTLGNSD
jgi:Family of unknown function (DUF6210)